MYLSIYTLIYVFIYFSIYLLIYLFTDLFIDLFICLFMYLCIYVFMYVLIYLVLYLLVYWLNYSCIHVLFLYLFSLFLFIKVRPPARYCCSWHLQWPNLWLHQMPSNALLGATRSFSLCLTWTAPATPGALKIRFGHWLQLRTAHLIRSQPHPRRTTLGGTARKEATVLTDAHDPTQHTSLAAAAREQGLEGTLGPLV